MGGGKIMTQKYHLLVPPASQWRLCLEEEDLLSRDLDLVRLLRECLLCRSLDRDLPRCFLFRLELLEDVEDTSSSSSLELMLLLRDLEDEEPLEVEDDPFEPEAVTVIALEPLDSAILPAILVTKSARKAPRIDTWVKWVPRTVSRGSLNLDCFLGRELRPGFGEKNGSISACLRISVGNPRNLPGNLPWKNHFSSEKSPGNHYFFRLRLRNKHFLQKFHPFCPPWTFYPTTSKGNLTTTHFVITSEPI